MYVAGGMIIALLSITRSRSFSDVKLDWAILALGTYEQILALSRTTLLALVILVPVILLSSRRSRRQLLTVALILGVLTFSIILVANPSTPAPVASFEKRIFDTNSQDPEILWRAQAADAMLSGLDSHLLTGFGFGRSPFFTIEDTYVQVQGGDPHDGFIYLLSGGGIFALASFLGVLFIGFRRLMRRTAGAPAEDSLVLWWSGAFLVVYLFNVATLPVISIVFFMPTLWILLGVPFASRMRAPDQTPNAPALVTDS
jgi:O-antigen ligase